MSTTRRNRLDPSVFHLPVARMREDYYSDKYFVRAREILLADRHVSHVVMQVFGKSEAYLGGMDEAIALLKLCSDDWKALAVRALHRRQDPRVRGGRGACRLLRHPLLALFWTL